MQIFVAFLSGKTMTFEVLPGETIAQLKTKISAREGLKADEQRLLYAGKALKGENTHFLFTLTLKTHDVFVTDEDTFESYNITKEATLHLMIRLPGGGDQ